MGAIPRKGPCFHVTPCQRVPEIVMQDGAGQVPAGLRCRRSSAAQKPVKLPDKHGPGSAQKFLGFQLRD